VRAYQIGKHSDESQHILREISAARVCLLNADKKAEYDSQLRSAAAAAAAAFAPAASAELDTISSVATVWRRHGARNQKAVWLLAVCGSAVVVLVAIAIGLFGGGDEAVQTAAKAPAVEPVAPRSKPSPDASTSDAESAPPGESKTSQGEQPAASGTVAAKPTGDAVPKESGAGSDSAPSQAQKPLPKEEPGPAAAESTPAAKTEPPPSPAASENPPPKQPPAETLEQAEQRLIAEAAQASTVETQQAKAREVLKVADQAIVDAKAELAKRLAVLALRLARKSNSAGLVDEATMRMIELAQPVTDALRDKARQRLDK
jgi:hypothetical protein